MLLLDRPQAMLPSCHCSKPRLCPVNCHKLYNFYAMTANLFDVIEM